MGSTRHRSYAKTPEQGEEDLLCSLLGSSVEDCKLVSSALAYAYSGDWL